MVTEAQLNPPDQKSTIVNIGGLFSELAPSRLSVRNSDAAIFSRTNFSTANVENETFRNSDFLFYENAKVGTKIQDLNIIGGQNSQFVNTEFGFHGGFHLRNTLDRNNSVYCDSDPGSMSMSILIGNSVGNISSGDSESDTENATNVQVSKVWLNKPKEYGFGNGDFGMNWND